MNEYELCNLGMRDKLNVPWGIRDDTGDHGLPKRSLRVQPPALVRVELESRSDNQKKRGKKNVMTGEQKLTETQYYNICMLHSRSSIAEYYIDHVRWLISEWQSTLMGLR